MAGSSLDLLITLGICLNPCNEDVKSSLPLSGRLLCACTKAHAHVRAALAIGRAARSIAVSRQEHIMQAVRMAREDKSFPTQLPLYVCFNPYFPDKTDLSGERRRLEEKLKHGSGLVKGIYLQVACPPHDISICRQSSFTHQPCCSLGPRFSC
jgi:hypothetical protein